MLVLYFAAILLLPLLSATDAPVNEVTDEGRGIASTVAPIYFTETLNCAENGKSSCIIKKLKFIAEGPRVRIKVDVVKPGEEGKPHLDTDVELEHTTELPDHGLRVRRSIMNSGKCAIGYRWVLFKCVPCETSACDSADPSDY